MTDARTDATALEALAGDTHEKLFNDMDDRIKALERGLMYCATMLGHAVEYVDRPADRKALMHCVEKSKLLAKAQPND
jgi:hypothetical protein